MNSFKTTAKAAAGMAFVAMATVPAMAQTPAMVGAPALSYNRAMRHDSNHTLLIVSAAVLVIGVIDSNSTLTILGAAGVFLSLSESGQMYRARSGSDLLKYGNVSLGFNAKGSPQAMSDARPYIQISSKF